MSSVTDRIRQFNSDRLAEYLPIKYKLMASDPFRFLRGTCHLFYEDLAAKDPLPRYPLGWICGDLHIENFGSFKGDNRLVYFDLNDFDEAILAPLSWELARLVTSIFVAFDSLGIPAREATRVTKLLLSIYSQTLASGRAKYLEPRVATGIVRSFLTQVEERRTKDLLAEKAEKTKNKIRLLIDNKRFFKLATDEKKTLMELLSKWMKQSGKKAYAGYEVMDAVFRVAGTGSIGVRRYAFLIVNRDHQKKAMLLDMKEAKISSLAPYVQVQQPSWENEANRVVSIQKRMVSTPPALLTDIGYLNCSFALKEMQPMEDKIDFMIIKDRYKDLETVVHEMAMLAASSQLRSSGRQGSDTADALIAFGQDQHWQQAILDYAKQYASQVRKDYTSFIKEYKAGKLS